MQGDIAAMSTEDGSYSGLVVGIRDETLDRMSALYYRMADAMLRARDTN